MADAAGKLIGVVTDRDLRRVAPSPLFGGSNAQVETQLEHLGERVARRAYEHGFV